MSISEEEKRALELQIREELEAEHKERELRAKRKADQRGQRNYTRPISKEKAEQRLRSEIRREFYIENNYKPINDPTGRKMWLSPSEQENKDRRKRPRKRHSRKLTDKQSRLFMYIAVALVAVVAGLIMVR